MYFSAVFASRGIPAVGNAGGLGVATAIVSALPARVTGTSEFCTRAAFARLCKSHESESHEECSGTEASGDDSTASLDLTALHSFGSSAKEDDGPAGCVVARSRLAVPCIFLFFSECIPC